MYFLHTVSFKRTIASAWLVFAGSNFSGTIAHLPIVAPAIVIRISSVFNIERFNVVLCVSTSM